MDKKKEKREKKRIYKKIKWLQTSVPSASR